MVTLVLLPAWQHRVYPPTDRLISFDIPDPDRVLRVTVIGTSLTSRPGWPEAFEAALSKCLGSTVSITRVARAGENSDWGATQISAVIETLPDLVTLEFSGNDADVYDGISLHKSEENHRQIISELRRAHPGLPIILMKMSPKYGLSAIMRPLLPRYLAIYPRLASEMDVGLIDFYSRWLTRPWAERGLREDGQHPDPVVAVQVIVPLLVSYVASAANIHCLEATL